MKKSLQRLLSVAALLILAIGGSWLHAETVTVCDGTTTNSLVPVYGSWVDTQGATSEFVIPASTEGMDEMVSGSISKLSFYLSSVAEAEWNATIQVYLAEVENTTLSGVVGPSACTVVYTGVLSATASPMEIEFDSPYTYEGGNLLIGTYVQTAGTWKAATFVGISASGAGYHSHGTTNTAVSFIPKTTFEYEPGGAVSCEKPVDFVVANVASHSADLSWSSSASSFELVLSTEGANDVISVVTDTFTTLSNLSDNTAYTVSVRAICQVGDSSRIVKKSFTTPCDPLAILMLTEGFEDVENTLGCWRKTGGGTLGVSTSTSNIHAGAQSLSMNGGAPASPMYLVLPQVDATLLTSARLRFWYKQSYTGATYPHFTIGSMSNPGDTSTFVAIKELDRTSTFTEAVADFNEIPAGHTYMVIKFAGGTSSTYGYIDDVEILPMPDCMEPATPNVLSVGTNEATLSWSPRGEEEMWQYLCIPSNQTPDWENFEMADDTIIELEGLLSNTAYTFYVKADCGDGLSEASSVSFKTPCLIVSAINWTEDFEDYPTGSSTQGPDCWNILDANGSTRPYVYITNTHTPLGEKSLFLETNTSKAGYALFPAMTDVQSVQISFSFKYENKSSGGDLHFGYLLDAADQNSFVSLTTCAHSSNAWTRSEKVALNGVPSGASIAFKLDASPSSYYYAMVDSIVMEDLPNCLKPVNLNVLNIDANSASVVWGAGSVESQYALVEEGDSLVWDDQNVVIVDSLALSNLNPNTSYTFYVRAYCSQGEQSDSALISFHTECLPIDSLPWSENFDELATGSSTSEAPYCWDILDANGASRPHVYVKAGNSPLGVKSLFLETQASTRGAAFAILPQLTEQANAQITFSYKYESATAGGDLHFGYMTNLSDKESFVALTTCARFTAWTEVEDVMLNTVPAGARLAFKLDVAPSSYYYAMVDNILIEELPSCYKPVNLSVDSVSDESAIITWDAGASETLWQYALVAAGDSLVWDDENIVITDSVALIGLDANSAYTFYVRAYCSAEESSEPVKVVFVTECAEINAIPYAEDFEGEGFDCWYVGNMQSTSSSYIPSVGTSYKYEGTKGLRLNAYSYVSSYSASYNTDADSALAILPALDYVGGIQQYRVQFYAKAGGTTVSSSTNYNQNLYVGIVDDSFSNFTLVEAVTMNGSTFTDFQVNLSNFNGIGGHIAFLAAVDTASTASTRYGQFYIDNVRVSLIPSCTRPDSLQITSLVQDMVSLTWQAGGNETQWQYVIAEEGAEPDWTNAILTEVPQAVVSGWNVNTNYKFYVRAYCSDQEQSEEAVASFYFGYCQPAPTSVDGGNGAITAVALQGVPATAAVHTKTAPFYNNNSAISFEVPAATEAQVAITFSTGIYPYGTVIWVDWNNNLEFEESEVVFAGQAPSGSGVFNCAFAVDATQAEGAYRMRIGAADSYFDSYISSPEGNVANPCNSGTYIIYEDYTLVVTAAPSCLQPANLHVVSVGGDNAVLTWEVAEAALTTPQWQYALVAEGDSLVWDAQNVIAVDTLAIPNLETNSLYDFYVRAYCSESDQSAAVVVSFKTTCLPIVGLPWSENFDSLATGTNSSDAPDCWDIMDANQGSRPYVYVTATNTPLGAKSLFLESNSSGPAYAVLPQLEDLSNAQISFSYKYESATAGGDLLFGYMTNPADETSFVALTTCARSMAWANVEELALTSVPAGAALAFKLNAPSYSFYYAMVDEILINELPNCQKPTDLILADLSETGAAIAWAGHGNELGWNWICCLDTVEPDWSAFNTVDSAFAVIDNLQPNTNYIFYVKAACGEADFSDVVSLSFYTGYCLPAPSSVDGSGITAIAFGGTVVDSAAHASSAPFFTDNTAIAYQVAPGANALIDIVYQTSYSYGTLIWVDWNHNLLFEENEVVFSGTSEQIALDTLHCSFAVPAAQEQGAYRMRIGGADNFFDSFISGSAAYQDAYSCSNGTYRLYEDYTLQVTNGPSTDIWAIFGDTENNGVKFVRDGHIYILRNGIIYDATGRKVEER